MRAAAADAIVIGGGPAGVAAALALRAEGVARVTLLDREPHLGGATRHCSHSPFGMRTHGRVYLGAAWGRRFARDLAAAGVTVLTGHSVVALEQGGVTVAHPGGIKTLGARRILMATGAREMPRAARMLPGDRSVGVLTTGALQAMVAYHGLMPFRRPVILGSELVTMSAILTCLTHGARPVAVVEPGPVPLVPAPFRWFPGLVRLPFHQGAEVTDILGQGRVEAVCIRTAAGAATLPCDGLLLTGRFTPEAALWWMGGRAVNAGTGGPAVDQAGRTDDPLIFAAGNLLRPVETGGWSYREGGAIGRAMAADLARDPDASQPVAVTHDDPVKLVVPNLIRPGQPAVPGFDVFQLRLARPCRGVLWLELDGRQVWRRRGAWWPERRVLVPMPAGVARAAQVHVGFAEEG
jgi:NADPH-dependent 2,4-dienoyl-CoA reductase/sulfur reductase-like enzyme